MAHCGVDEEQGYQSAFFEPSNCCSYLSTHSPLDRVRLATEDAPDAVEVADANAAGAEAVAEWSFELTPAAKLALRKPAAKAAKAADRQLADDAALDARIGEHLVRVLASSAARGAEERAARHRADLAAARATGDLLQYGKLKRAVRMATRPQTNRKKKGDELAGGAKRGSQKGQVAAKKARTA